jgi:hypothetical protein
MKIKIDIDCTPEEARAFMGLPDARPLHEAMLAELRARMSKGLGALDPEELLKAWAPFGGEGFEALRKAFWSGMAAGMDEGGKAGGKAGGGGRDGAP